MREVESAVIDRTEFAERLEIFFGEASDAVAHVYARLAEVGGAGELKLSGHLRGPSCLYADTLPARFPLVDRGPGKSLLAEAIVPEPCFWTPEMPHLYQAEVELRDGTTIIAGVRRAIAIRTLGVAGRKLIYDAKRWVLRAVRADEVAATSLEAWRESSTAMLARHPGDELCEAASRVGVLVVAELDEAIESEIRRLSRWPAVGLVALNKVSATFFRGWGHNLLVAQRFAATEPVALAPWAQVAVVEVADDGDLARRVADCPAAVIPMRPAGPMPSVMAGRAECDRLQRHLAGDGDWAGYIV
jgi:hypothetical protein